MADLQQYQAALQRAQANNDAEAVAYFQQKIAELQRQQNIDQYMQPEQGRAQQTIQRIQQGFAKQTGITVPETVIAGLVGAGKGATDIVRGLRSLVGLDNEIPEGEVENWQAVQDEFPVSSTVGEVAAQAAPFVAAGPLAATARSAGGTLLAQSGRQGVARLGQQLLAPMSRRAMIGSQAGLGALEGGVIMAGQAEPIDRINKLKTALAKAEANNDTEAADYFRTQIADAESSRAIDTTVGAGVGGTIAGAVEAVMPRIGRAISKIGRKLIFKEGNPSDEVLEALAREGVSPEEAKPVLQRIYAEYGDAANPDDVARMGLFEKYGVPATKGDIQGDFAQQAYEARLIESSTDEFADPMRAKRLDQSEKLKGILEQQVQDLGVPDRAGETLISALEGREAMLRGQKNQLYKQLADEAQNVESIPLLIDTGSDAALKRRISRLSPSQVKALDETLLEFGIGSEQALKEFAESGNDIMPLSLSNAEEFRQAINLIERSDQSGAIKTITGPLKRSLDDELETAISYLQQQGRDTNLGDIARAARETTRELKTEFDPQATVGRLVAKKRDGVTPVVEASNVLREIFRTGQVSKKEKLERVLTALRKQGDDGKVAIGDMQSAAIQRIIDDAWGAPSRTISGERVIGGNAFQRSMDKFGEAELEMLFKDNPQALAKLRDIRKMVDNITPPAAAVPKGSSSTQLDILNFLSRQMMGSKIPGINIVLEGATGLVEKSAKRKAAQEAGKAVPRWTQREIARAMQIRETMPQLAAALGIANIGTEEVNQATDAVKELVQDEEENNEPLQ